MEKVGPICLAAIAALIFLVLLARPQVQARPSRW